MNYLKVDMPGPFLGRGPPWFDSCNLVATQSCILGGRLWKVDYIIISFFGICKQQQLN